MEILNIEIKARSNDQREIREILKAKKADYKGTDHQIDTYFKVPNGRLKLREGTIENNLIHYLRDNKDGPKQSKITLFKSSLDSTLKDVLTRALGILTVVDKEREIYFIENVKFHLDKVKGLGTFVEIEAIDKNSTIGKEKLQFQCEYYLKLFDISKEDLVSESYSDLILAIKQPTK